MRNLEVIIMLPLANMRLLALMAVDLIRMIQGKPTVDEEWHEVYVDSNMNHGQGRKGNEKDIKWLKEEQKYYVMNEENELILGWSQSAYMTPCIEGYEYMKHNGRENLFQLTEHEIKDYDERYWAFAKPVEE